VPFKKNIGHGDFDVLGYNPKTKEVLLVDCKARGSPESYPNMDTPARRSEVRERVEELKNDWDCFIKGKTNKWELKKFDEVRLVPFQRKMGDGMSLRRNYQELSVARLKYYPFMK